MVKGANHSQDLGWGWQERPGVEEYVKLGYAPNNATSQGEHGRRAPPRPWSGRSTTSPSPGSPPDRRPRNRGHTQRGQNWQNIFNPATGYLRPRDDNGAFPDGPASRPRRPAPSARTATTRATPRQYNWSVQQNIAGLIAAMGGKDTGDPPARHLLQPAQRRAERAVHLGRQRDRPTAPWVYDYVGQPWKTQARSQPDRDRLFTTPGRGARQRRPRRDVLLVRVGRARHHPGDPGAPTCRSTARSSRRRHPTRPARRSTWTPAAAESTPTSPAAIERPPFGARSCRSRS